MGRYRRYLIALGVLGILLGLYAVAGFWAVPHFARSAATDFVRSHYGRTLRLGELRFNPFTLRLDASEFSLPDADGKTLLAFQHLHLDLQLATLWHLAPSFREIRLERPYMRAVIRPDGELNLADLGKGFPTAPQPARPAKPLRLYVGRLALISGSATFVDRTRPQAFEADFNPINLELRDFSTIAGNGNAYRLTAASPQGERLRWEGTLGLTPLSSRGVFEITDLKARTLWEYVRASVPFEIDSGIVGLRGDYELDAARTPLAIKVLVRNTTLTDLGLRPRGETQNYVQLGRLEVEDTQLDLVRRSVGIRQVKLAGGELRVWLDESGQLNLRRLTASPAADKALEDGALPARPPADAVRPAPPAPAWLISAPQISVEGLRIAAEDRQVNPHLAVRVAPLNVQVSGFSTAEDAVLKVSLDAALEPSGTLSAQARVVPASSSVSAQLEAHDLSLPLLQPYLARYTSMTLLKGALGSQLDVQRRANGALEVKGGLQITGLRTVDNSQRRDFITWKELKVIDLDYHSEPQSLKVRGVTLIEPYARVIVRPNRTLNVSEVLTPSGPATATATAAAPPEAAPHKVTRKPAPPGPAEPTHPAPSSFPLAIGSVRFVNATLDYTDLWIKPSFAVGIQALNGSVTGLSSDPRSRASVKLDGKVDRYSPAHIGGEVNLLSAALYSDITMSFRDIDLTIVNPYSGHFMGYKIDKGKLSVDVSYLIERRQLNAKQHFVIDQLELGERVESPDAVHLPLKLAVALLKDRNGVIDVDLPMSGTLDDPHFRIGPLIWKAFVNLLVKAATAPFALLGHLFGGGENMNVIEFAPGSAELEGTARQQLAAVTKSLQERPQLKVDVPIVYWPQLDGPALAARQLQQQLLARTQKGHEAARHPGGGEAQLSDPAQHFRLLIEEYRDRLGKDVAFPDSAQTVQAAKRKENPSYDAAIADMSTALIARMAVADAELDALGKERARAIQDALLSGGQIDPARLFIIAAQPPAGSGERVKVELALK